MGALALVAEMAAPAGWTPGPRRFRDRHRTGSVALVRSAPMGRSPRCACARAEGRRGGPSVV